MESQPEILNIRQQHRHKITKQPHRLPYRYKSKTLINKINFRLKRRNSLDFKNAGQKFFEWVSNGECQNCTIKISPGDGSVLKYLLQSRARVVMGPSLLTTTPASSLASLTGSLPFQLSALWRGAFQLPQLPVAGMPPPVPLLGSRALWLLVSSWRGARACNHSRARHFGAVAPKTSSFLASLQPTWQIKGQPRAWKRRSQGCISKGAPVLQADSPPCPPGSLPRVRAPIPFTENFTGLAFSATLNKNHSF